ncbi:hypothetical protein GOZ90_27000 [Agrobacterium vitis]|uniref:Uncharacterized protein n=1 Tax=Agrobacterium vitis TaxID=373 RepID=A0A6L6VPJ9_AGRVI|nr:hypothetical protein [Agrobacterium vitis]MUZ76269.1 hypothetical protein [Agrobacterium vitis]
MEFNIVCPHVQYMRTDGLIYRATGHPFLAVKFFFVAKIPQSVQKLFEGMMACAFRCRNSAGDEIFLISISSEPDKALLGTFVPVLGSESPHREGCHALTAAIRPATPTRVIALLML